MTKDEWIQYAKALLFDIVVGSSAEECLKKEAQDLINQGGGYDCMVESCETPLKWKE